MIPPISELCLRIVRRNMRILYQSRKSFSSGKYKNFAQKRILKIPHRFRIMNSHFLPSPYSLGFRTIQSMKKSDFRSFSTTTLRSNISHRAKRDISRIPKGMPFSFCVSKTFHSKAELSLPHTPQIRTIQSMKKSDFRSFSTSILHSQLSILNYRKAPLFHQTPLIFPVFSKTLQIILRKNHLDG